MGTQIPQGPATPLFLDRARAVAQAVRTAGLPKPPEGIFLYGTRTPDLAFDTTEQKVAWIAGYVAIAPGVQLGSGGTTRIDFTDGPSVSVDVLAPRPALTAAIGATHDNCGHMAVPAAKCILVITGGSLKTVEVDTSAGRATVPAWSFTAKGLSRPIVALAVSPAVLKPLPQPTTLPGLADPDRDLLSVGSLTRADGNTLTVNLHHGKCDPDLRAHVLELDDMVIIGGSHAPFDGACVDVGLSTPATVTLTASLGDKPVISAETGTRLDVYPHLR
ncbi:hypothetical protein [Kribbella sindirgiensis]|uniref:Uncharacterized protein n=1 Tax=Kribbella sindirgiensis TaxID=1124744 RepID=A0A4V2M2Y1_9ACTN|nr:hypothetical protein [Kribbella sindirgiensis]TCC29942.1 hypothetical protein E0H50_26275 [Kribbella sindirgiensis]